MPRGSTTIRLPYSTIPLGPRLSHNGVMAEQMTAEPDIAELFRNDELFNAAHRRAFRRAVLEHRAFGVPMSFQENGEIIHVDPNDVPLPPEE
ncbi:MAG: hypothetical protein ACRD4P_08225 [Bryobacteraceae bacterium]